MPRPLRITPGGFVFHVLNRGNGRQTLFTTPADYRHFLIEVAEAGKRTGMRLLAYCAMPNHWHLLLWPMCDGDVSRFVQLFASAHTQRWLRERERIGEGHIYQSRFKSFPVGDDRSLLAVCRYVERNAMRAGLVERSADWPWSSFRRHAGLPAVDFEIALTPLPVSLPDPWMEFVDAAQTEAELQALRLAVRRGHPFGDSAWRRATVDRLGLEAAERPVGRPRKRGQAPFSRKGA